MRGKVISRLVWSLIILAMMLSAFQAAIFAQSEGMKWTEKETEYGFNVIAQEGGPTLSYSPESGIEILTVDGFAFKDLNRNGELDKYEDWRLDTKTRAASLADLMVAEGRSGIEKIAGLMLYSAHTAVDSADVAEATKIALLENNLRHVLVTTLASPTIAAGWNNNLQAMVEGVDYGIPANNSSDPRHSAGANSTVEYNIGNTGAISLWPSSMGMTALFDPAVEEVFGNIAATEYRALGISTALSPQIDLATEPRWSRVDGTMSENSEIATEMARAYIDGFQTTEGSETGWGINSVNAMAKHWPGGGPHEAGRDSHLGYGKFAVFPGDNFAEQLVPFTEGAFKLQGGTGMASAIMPFYTISYAQDIKNGEEVGNNYSEYLINDLLRGTYGFDGVVCTDWRVTHDAVNDHRFSGMPWGMEDKTIIERHYKVLMAGVDQFGGNNDMVPVMGAYDMMVADHGQEFADQRFAESARRLLTNIFNPGLFENPYLDVAATAAVVGNAEFMRIGYETQLKSIVMLKNKNNFVKQRVESDKRLTAYVPMYHYVSVHPWFGRRTEETKRTVGLENVLRYYNVTNDPSEADFALVGMTAPTAGIGYDAADLEAGGNGYVPITLQYGEYTADTARETSIANDGGKQFINSATGEVVYTDEAYNRSYRGKTVTAANSSMLDLLAETKEAMGDKPVVVYMRAANPMVWSEVEPLADVILVGYSVQDQAVVEILAGVTEPSALLPMQQPINMETVESQLEDIAQDMDCYMDSEGNTYDFAFGLNWTGQIRDERTLKYAGF